MAELQDYSMITQRYIDGLRIDTEDEQDLKLHDLVYNPKFQGIEVGRDGETYTFMYGTQEITVDFDYEDDREEYPDRPTLEELREKYMYGDNLVAETDIDYESDFGGVEHGYEE